LNGQGRHISFSFFVPQPECVGARGPNGRVEKRLSANSPRRPKSLGRRTRGGRAWIEARAGRRPMGIGVSFSGRVAPGGGPNPVVPLILGLKAQIPG